MLCEWIKYIAKIALRNYGHLHIFW